jgi:hypothetical protein
MVIQRTFLVCADGLKHGMSQATDLVSIRICGNWITREDSPAKGSKEDQ